MNFTNFTFDIWGGAYCSLKLFRYVVFETHHIVLFCFFSFFFFTWALEKKTVRRVKLT